MSRCRCLRTQADAAQARGGGRSGTDGTQIIWSSATASVTSGGSYVTTAATIAGGGSETPHENHSATMPPQASMARSTTSRGCGGSSAGAEESSAVTEAGVLANDRYSLQISSPSRSSDGVERAGLADFLAQHPDPAFRGSAATLRSSAARTPASMSWALAQASRSAGVWQQQFAKHCSAVAQPHGLSMHGNGFERSLPESRLADEALSWPGDENPMGRGRPETTSA